MIYEQMSVLQEANEQMGIKNRLNEIKSLKSMNIKEFSEATNLSYRTAQNYLSGDREPNLEGLTKIHTHLGVNLNWLLTGIGEPFETTFRQPETALNTEEQELLDNYRQASDNGKFVISSVARTAEKKEIETRKVA